MIVIVNEFDKYTVLVLYFKFITSISVCRGLKRRMEACSDLSTNLSQVIL